MASAIDSLNVPYERLTLPEKALQERYAQALADGRKEGWTPLLLFIDESDALSFAVDNAIYQYGSLEAFTRHVLDGMRNIDPARFRPELADDFEYDDSYFGDMELEDGLVVVPDATDVYLLRIPCKSSWEVFAYVPFGDFNDCPDNAVHAAFARFFFERYGARVMAIGTDAVQYQRETLTPVEEADARMFVSYCPSFSDDVPVPCIADTLSKVHTWFFWYD